MTDAELAKLIQLLRERERPDPLTVPAMRARMELIGEKFLVPPEAIVERIEVAGVAAEWLSAPGANPNRQLLYLHGGGYVQGSLATHRLLAYGIGAAADARVLLLDYRLAPEHPFPAALDDAVAAWTWLLARGGQPARMAIAGDSAGGGLTVAALAKLRAEGLPLPACALCISPWIDLRQTGETMSTKAAEDPMLDRGILEWFAGHYAGTASLDDPYLSPLHADLRELPPLMVQVGSAEVLLDDARRLVARAERAGVETVYEEVPHMPHVWHLFAPMLSEGRDAIARAGAWIARRTR